jgi:hypothetical protein
VHTRGKGACRSATGSHRRKRGELASYVDIGNTPDWSRPLLRPRPAAFGRRWSGTQQRGARGFELLPRRWWEATSALDSENEKRIQSAIEELHGRMTILVITHRLSTIRGADVIHVLEQGRLVESGDWDTLIMLVEKSADLAPYRGRRAQID